MKKTLAISLLVGAATVGSLCGCASNKGQQTSEASQPTAQANPPPAKPEKPPKDKRPIEDRLKVGMTMDEVLQVAGKPKGKSVNSDGSEVWTYNNLEGRALKDAFIPYYSLSGSKARFVTVVFGTDGKVKSWSTSEQGGY